ncbi:MAG: lamin tail domain-containing protein, partial [Chloroflexota bacterium]
MTKRQISNLVVCIVITFLLAPLHRATPAFAVGEASTHFGIYIPPNASNAYRDPSLIITAMHDGTIVDIVDDDDDGDSDDTHLDVELDQGESYVIMIQQGVVNDDFGGPLATQGDFFQIEANLPVVVMNATVNTAWEHDYIPADNKRMAGKSFFFYVPNVAHSSTPPQLNLFAFTDQTQVHLYDITAQAKTTSGHIDVLPVEQGQSLLNTVLDAGEDLRAIKQVELALDAGHTYHLVSNKDIVAQFGSLGKADHQARDGGGYVPGKGGSSADKVFYFTLPYFKEHEREMRVVAYGEPANLSIRGWNETTTGWDEIIQFHLEAYGHKEFLGSALGSGYYYFEVVSDETISIFETNWFETTNVDYKTADIATYISSEDGSGAGTSFLAYLGPPSTQPDLLAETEGSIVQRSRLYISARQAANIEVFDPDPYGEWIELYNSSDRLVDLSGWTLTNAAGKTIEFPQGTTIEPHEFYLLEYHSKAAEGVGNLEWSALAPSFTLRNGGDTLTLSNGADYQDTVRFDSTNWGIHHGNFYSLARVDVTQPFSNTNYVNGSIYHANDDENLGEYYGTPGILNTYQIHADADGVIINEIMAGRIYHSLTVPANGFQTVGLTIDEWEGLHNGDGPASSSTDPEGPY